MLLWIDKRFKVRPGHLMGMYVLGYGVIRFFVEGLRIDEAHHVGGLRWNQWVALAGVLAAAAYLIITRRRGDTEEGATMSDEPLDSTSAEGDPGDPDDDPSGDAPDDEGPGDDFGDDPSDDAPDDGGTGIDEDDPVPSS